LILFVGFGVLTPSQIPKLIGVEIGGKDAGMVAFVLF
jgi:hypothetical protein